MATPADCRFTDSHEWFRADGDVVTVGITQYAANELTDITYVEMKPSGEQIDPGSVVGEVESVKTTSDVYSVVGGEIVEVNDKVTDDPSLLNSDPYENGWLIKIKFSDKAELEGLLSAEDYAAYVSAETES